MAVTAGSIIKRLYSQQAALGDKAKNSDFYLEIAGFEGMGIMFKQFPWPVLSSGEPVEVAGPLGTKYWQPSQVKTNFQGAFTIAETPDGKAQAFLESIIGQGGRANGKLYEGIPSDFTRVIRIFDIMFQVDSAIDRDWENNTQILLINGTAAFSFFGVEA